MSVNDLESLLKQSVSMLSEENYVITIVNNEAIFQSFFDLKEGQHFIDFDEDNDEYIVNKRIGDGIGDKIRYETIKEALKKLEKLSK